MKLIIPAIFVALITTTTQAEETNPIYQTPDAQSKFREAQLHVQELMKAGRYTEASKFMSVYQTLACEAAEQKAGRSTEEGAAICARKNKAGGINAGQSSQQPDQPAMESFLGPGITVMQRTAPGSSSVLDGSAPSIFVFDPRSVPGAGSQTNSRSDTKADPWTGKP
ncbi:hypothetical protein [Nitrosospira sp. NpAV]|uniref:hypothetical protein n=1 Tax=Nitrosospira sp. NpAV TaxID=58133 RepID=UPI0005A262F3|nr:hypothetical protein [Nitrosospira sp. NpAV]KIO48078.1 hypothetical protein SQ11_12810 [Nitrosospira sp. NpAV]